MLRSALGAVFIFGALMISMNQALAVPQKPTQHASGTAEFHRIAQQATQARESNQLERATTLYRQGLKMNPSWKEGWWYLGTLYYDDNQYPSGMAAFRNLVKLDPDYGAGWALLGLCEFEISDYTDSQTHIHTAMRKGLGDNVELINATMYHAALLGIMQGDFEAAAKTLSNLVARGTLSNVVRFALGMALLRVPMLPNQVDPSKDALINQAGEAGELMALENYDQAGAVFEKLVKDYPTAPYVHYAYASMLAQLARYDEAEKQFQKEIDVTPDSPISYMHLAYVYLRVSRYKDALPLSQKAVQMIPDSYAAHYLLGRALLGTGQTQAAVKELEAAKRLGPNSPEVRYNLAMALAQDNQPEAAARERAEFMRLNALAQQSKSQGGSAGQSYRMSNSRGTLEPSQVRKPPGGEPQ